MTGIGYSDEIAKLAYERPPEMTLESLVSFVVRKS